MELREQIDQQRVKYIVSSYQLDESDSAQVSLYLEELFECYPSALIELALVETLVDHWLSVPMVRGLIFFAKAHTKLKTWENQPIVSTVTPDQFQQITGLDPTPVFGSADRPSNRPIVSPDVSQTWLA
jgi:hypothetical protein